MFTLNCKGKLIIVEKPLIMGIINVNADSFYEGSRFKDLDAIAVKAEQMINEGADILDIGGQSTRPASLRISAEEEIKRVIPVVEMLSKKTGNVLLSIDTYHSSVAEAAVNAGASFVNDISAGEMDKNMIATVASLGVPFICMHMKGLPETMHLTIHYENIITEVLDFFIKKTEECRLAGIKDVIIDPGFGFGKTVEHNFQLLNHLDVLKIPGLPVLAGLSRKSMNCKVLKVNPDKALNGTTALNAIALMKGARLLRVHDVKEAREVIELIKMLS